MNKVMIVGRLGQDCEVIEAGERKFAKLRVATDDGYRGADDKWVDRTRWHNVITFQPGLIGWLQRDGTKGRLISLVGELNYYTPEGEKRPEAQILLDRNAEVNFLTPAAS